MKKIVSILLAMSMMLTMLAACNKEPVEDLEDPNDQQQEEVNPDDNQGGEEVILPETLDIVVDGISEYVIVTGETDHVYVQGEIAYELQKYIKLISGAELPIVRDSANESEKEIILGQTTREKSDAFNREELTEEGFIIKSVDSKIYIVGGNWLGTYYAMYEFLEKYLGCRFFTEDIERIPEAKTISIEKIEEDKQIPVFEYRETDWYKKGGNNLTIKHRINGWYNSFILWCHTFQELVPTSKYFAEHPEYFAMDENGNRTGGNHIHNVGNDSQLCMTNPEVTRVLIEETRARLNSHSDNPKGYVSLSINDNRNYCHCPECERVYAEDNNTTDCHLRVVNDVATALKDEFPNVTFEFLSYFHTRPVPTSVKAAENVVVRMAFIEECFSHPLEECTEPAGGDSGVKAAIEIKEWAKFADKIFIWDYTCNYENYPAPYPNFDTLLKNERYYADNNVKGIFHEGQLGGSDVAEFADLRKYLLSKTMWNPYMTDEEYNNHINEFMEGVYGPGWTHIREYFDLLHEVTEDVHFGCFKGDMSDIFDLGKAQEMHKQKEFPEDLTADMIRNYETVDWTKYWNFFRDIPGDAPSIISEGERLFALAMEQAETDLQKKYIDKSYTQVEYLKSFYISKKLGYGGSALGKIMINFFKANPDEFTQQEQDTFRMAIVKLSRAQAYGQYEAYNRALVEKLGSLGLNLLAHPSNAKYISEIDLWNLANTPDEWYD